MLEGCPDVLYVPRESRCYYNLFSRCIFTLIPQRNRFIFPAVRRFTPGPWVLSRP